MVLNKCKRLKKFDRKKFSHFIFLLILSVSFFIFLLMFTLIAYTKEQLQYDYVYVQEGDTIWSIAQNYSANTDIRKIVSIIIEENDILDALIYPGDIIKIPLL